MSKIFKKSQNINVDIACRTCLSERAGNLRDIIGNKICKMLEECASIQVIEDDDLPKQICFSCFRQIAKFYTFKKKILRSQNMLKNYIKPKKLKEKPERQKADRHRRKHCTRSDILFKAVNEAEISMHEENMEINDNASELSEEDIPLSQRKIKINVERQEDVVIEDYTIQFEDDLKIAELDLSNDLIFSDGPPPLVPLQNPVININPLTNYNFKPNLQQIAPIKAMATKTPGLLPIIKSLVSADNEKIVTVDVNLECIICSNDFDSIEALTQHRLHECKSTALQCNICKKNFEDRKKLIGHLKGHMISKDYACKICHKRYPNPSTIKVHMRTHTGERPFKCEICHKGFVRWAGVVGHMKTHSAMKPFKCNECGKTFKIQSNLERHKVLHTGSLPFCCCYCGKTFSQSDNLQLHVRTYHTFEKPFLCNECGKGFVSSTRLTRHMWVHSGYKPYGCQHCTKSYANSNDLKIHMRSHSSGASEGDKPHACAICQMRFFHLCRLSRHMKIHEKKSCNRCHRSYPTHALLSRHVEEMHLQSNESSSQLTDDNIPDNIQTYTDDPLSIDNFPADNSVPINDQEDFIKFE